MSFEYCNNLKFTIFGQSHSPAIGGVLDCLPCGYVIDQTALQEFCDRRRAVDELSTTRRERDEINFLSGIFNGKTCGSPIAFAIANGDVRSQDYEKLVQTPRPSHADYTSSVKYSGFADYRGGGHFSGRLTAPLTVIGGIAKQILSEYGVKIGAHLYSVKNQKDKPFDLSNPKIKEFKFGEFPAIDDNAAKEMQKIILSAKNDGDSVGGIIECAVTGLPAGLGSPNFDGMENIISRLAFAVPAVKGIEFGNGFFATTLFGSENNDVFVKNDGKVITATNNSGGINGGITNGMPIVFRVAMKPTPSINKPQTTLNVETGEMQELIVGGRHDPCVVVRAVPVIESVAAIAILDMIIERKKDELNKGE